MIKTFNIQPKQVEKRKSNAVLIAIIAIVFVFLIAVTTTCLVVMSNKSKEKIGVGSEGGSSYGNNTFYQTIDFYDLKADNSTFKVNASDFVVYSNNVKSEYVCFENDASVLTITKDAKTKTIKLYFESENGISEIKIYYKGELIEYTSPVDVADTLIQFITLEAVICVFLLVLTILIVKQAQDTTQKGDKYKRINESVLEVLKTQNFALSNAFYISSPRTGVENISKLMLCVDDKNKKMAFIDYQNLKLKIVDFKDIVSYKIFENDGVEVQSSMLIGIFDIPYTTTETKDVCKKLQFVIVLNDEKDTNVVYEIIKSGVSIDSNIYKKISKSIIDVTSYLDIIIKNTPKDKVYVYCKYCGAKNPGDSSHCSSCGGLLD